MKNKLDKLTIFGIGCLIFVIAGLFGFIYEFVFYYLNSGMKTFYYRGGNFLPWINIYATGSFLIYILTRKLKDKPIFVFLVSAITCGVLELISGYVLYSVLDMGPRCWNYNVEMWNFGNIGGFVCLRSVLFFGLSGLILMYLIIPFCTKLALKCNRKVFLIIAITLASIVLFDELYNLVFAHMLSLPRASTIYKELGFKYIYF